MSTRTARIAALALPFLAAPAAADVFIFGQPGSYATLQAAVDAAVDGDVLLLEAGSTLAEAYATTHVDGKGLHLLGLPPGPNESVWLNGTLEVRNLPASSVFTIGDMEVAWGYQTTPKFNEVDALRIEDCAGQVRVQRCYLRGSVYTSGTLSSQRGAGLRVESSPRVAVSDSDLFGGVWKTLSGLSPQAGGAGLLAIDSSVAIYDSHLQGGGGSHETYPAGGAGGAGIQVSGWGVLVSGCTVLGGAGGGGDYIGCTVGGDGGPGLYATNAQVRLLATDPAGGAGGIFGFCGPGSPGQDIELDGAVLIQHPGEARSLAGLPAVDDGNPLTFSVTGVPGDRVWILRGRAPVFQPTGSALGIVLVPKPWVLPVAPMGIVPASGTLDVTLWIADMVSALPGAVLFAQALAVGTGGEVRLSGPLHVLVRNT